MKWLFKLGVLTLFLWSHSANAQESMVYFVVNPGHEFKVKFDNDSISELRSCSLPAGQYDLQIWSPGYDIFDTTLTVASNQVHKLYVKLERPVGWHAWNRANQKFNLNQSWKKAGSILGGTALITNGVIQTVRYNRMHQDVERIQTEYRDSADPSEIQSLRLELSEVQNDMRRQEIITYSSLGVATIGAAAMIYINMKLDQQESPKYDDKVKVRFYSDEQAGALNMIGASLQYRF